MRSPVLLQQGSAMAAFKQAKPGKASEAAGLSKDNLARRRRAGGALHYKPLTGSPLGEKGKLWS